MILVFDNTKYLVKWDGYQQGVYGRMHAGGNDNGIENVEAFYNDYYIFAISCSFEVILFNLPA